MKLSQYAKNVGVTWRTAYSYFKEGSIRGAYQRGTIVVPYAVAINPAEHIIVYARVSSAENKPNLESPADRMVQFCNAKGWCVHEIVKECASGLNDARPKSVSLTAFSFGESRAIGLGDGSETCYVSAFRNHP